MTGLAASGVRPEELIAGLKAHPAIAPLIKGATLHEYDAHLIPEGGYDAMPTLAGDGLLVAGDAAGLTLAAGIWLEGVNFAIGSGLAAGQAAAAALASGDVSAAGLGSYRRALDANFVLQDHRRLRAAPHLILSERMQGQYTAPDVRPRRADVHGDQPGSQARPGPALPRHGPGPRGALAGPGP